MAAKKSSATRSMRRPKTPLKKPSPKAESALFPIVAIGASLAGSRHLSKFFTDMPQENSSVGFVLVYHLDPSLVRALTPIYLKKYTKMAILQAEDGMKVQRDRVHVLPPNTEIVHHAWNLAVEKAERAQRPEASH